MPCTQAVLETVGTGTLQKHAWHVVRLSFGEQARGGIHEVTLLSCHVHHEKAKLPVAGPQAVSDVLDQALMASSEIDFVTGDFNGARQADMCIIT